MTCFVEEGRKWLPFIFVITYTERYISYQVLYLYYRSAEVFNIFTQVSLKLKIL